jgi:hypothetical protein
MTKIVTTGSRDSTQRTAAAGGLPLVAPSGGD